MADDGKERAIGCLRRAVITQLCCSPARRSITAAVSRDLPMPGSPESSTTWPSPLFALSQRRRINSSSSSRPTSAVRPSACNASKRLSTEAGRSAAQALTGPTMPLKAFAPRSPSSKRLPTSFRVLFAITTLFGCAMPCSRAARLGVSPTIACSWEGPEPIRSPTTTRPVAMPTRVWSGAWVFRAPTTCAHGQLCVVLMGLGIPEIHQHPVAHVLRNEAAEATHGLGDALLISRNHFAEVFRVHAGRERR